MSGQPSASAFPLGELVRLATQLNALDAMLAFAAPGSRLPASITTAFRQAAGVAAVTASTASASGGSLAAMLSGMSAGDLAKLLGAATGKAGGAASDS